MSSEEESRETESGGMIEFMKQFCFETPAGIITLVLVLAAIVGCYALKANRDIMVERAKQGFVREYQNNSGSSSDKWVKVQ